LLQPLRALARTRIGPRTLTTQRQAAAVPNASVATEVHESLDVHRDFAAQIALDGELRDHFAQARDLRIREVLDLRARLHAGCLASHERLVTPDPEDMRQRDANVLVGRNVDARYTCHSVVL
jgi:hypothetical protein